MKHWRILTLAALLAGCDEVTIISHVDRLPGIDVEDMRDWQDGRGIPVEIHGSPYSHVTDYDLAAVLRPPNVTAGNLTFYAAAAGSWKDGHDWRLVLHFNPQGPPNSFSDCKLVEEARTNRRPETGFTVNASFCKRDQWQAHAYLQVLEIEDGDLEAYASVMQALMLTMLGEENDP